MNVRKTDAFVADVERQFEWYAVNANWSVADRYLDAVEATCHLLGRQPQLGPRGLRPPTSARVALLPRFSTV